MEKDGYNPVTHILTDHIKPSYKNADIICRFYDNLSSEQVKKAMESMISYNRLLIAPSRLKRMFIYGLLGITGNYKEMHGLIVNYKPNPLCGDSTQKLSNLYDSAVKLAAILIGEFRDSAAGHIEFNKMYDYTFGSKLENKDNNGKELMCEGREAV